MNYLHLARRRMAPALGGYRAGAAADENDQIRLIDDGARLWRAAVGADDADGEWMLIADGALAADGGSDRSGEPLRKLEKFLLRAGDHHAAAAEKHRMGRAAQQFCRASDEVRVWGDAAGRILAEGCIAPDVGPIHRAFLHVERQRDVRRTRPAGGHLVKRGAEGARDLLRAIEDRVPFRDRAHERALVKLGEGVPAPRRNGDVGVDAKHRHRRLIRFCETRKDIGRAPAARPLTDTDSARNARIAVCHIRRRPFVAREDVAHAVRQPRQRVIKRQTGVAAQAEEDLDAVRLQHLDHGFGAAERGASRLG